MGEKIDYPRAMRKYGNRQNVLLTKKNNIRQDIKWRYPALMQLSRRKYGDMVPDFLRKINSNGETFYQSHKDDHEIDNWKCRRIYHCNKNHFADCIEYGTCMKENESLCADKYRNYVVANPNKWEDLDDLRIRYCDLANRVNLPETLCTPKGQHNVRKVDKQIDEIFSYIERIKACKS